MTDQDPTQPFEVPATPVPTAPPVPPAPDATQVVPPAPPAPPAGYAAPGVPAPAAAMPVVPAMPIEAVAAGAVPVEPVAASSGKRPGRSKIKWVVAGVVTLLVVGTAAAGTLVLTSDSGDPAVLAWTPADSVAYSELRLDLPGTQAKELPALMQAFPGFEDQAAFPIKLSEVLDQVTGAASDGKVSWKNDIDPWFGGQVSASIGALPTELDASDVHALILLSVEDQAKATSWIDGMVKAEGATTTTETDNGVTITLVTHPGEPSEMAAMQPAYAVIGPVLAMGDLDSVKASIATNGKSGLPTDAQFQEAEASVSGDRLAFAYLDAAAITDAAIDLAGAAAEMLPELPATITDLQVPWAVMALRAEDGSFIVDTRSPHVAAMGAPKNAKSTLPDMLPPTTVFLAEGHDVGEALARTKQQLASEPSLKDGVKQVEEALQILGGFEAVTGWMGEAGIAITLDGEDIAGGLLVTPTDAAAADRLFTQLNGFIAFGGAQVGLEATEVDYKGTTIHVLDLSGIAAMGGEALGTDLPADASIAYAVTDDVVVLGYGTDFVKAVLDAKDGESLADQDRFASALAQAGVEHASLVWLDIAAVRGAVEGMIPNEMKTDYEKEFKPYLVGFDALIGTTTPGEQIDAGTLILRTAGS